MSKSAVGAKQSTQTGVHNQPALKLMGLLAHQISQPVTVLLGEVELARQSAQGEAELRGAMERCFLHLERAARLVSDLRTVGEMSRATARLISLPEMIEQVIQAQKAGADSRGVQVDWKPPVHAFVDTDPEVLQRAISIALSRAIRGSFAGGVVKARLEESQGKAEIRFAYIQPRVAGSVQPHDSEAVTPASVPVVNDADWALAEGMMQLLGGSIKHFQSAESCTCISLVLTRANPGL